MATSKPTPKKPTPAAPRSAKDLATTIRTTPGSESRPLPVATGASGASMADSDATACGERFGTLRLAGMPARAMTCGLVKGHDGAHESRALLPGAAGRGRGAGGGRRG